MGLKFSSLLRTNFNFKLSTRSALRFRFELILMPPVGDSIAQTIGYITDYYRRYYR